MKFYYSHGRTAFKAGLSFLGLKKKDQILLPEYLCDVLLDPLKRLKIKPIFYKVNDNFTINFLDVKKKFNKKVKALLIINFFGFEEDKNIYINFCKRKKIYLLEDNCHSLRTSVTKKNLLPDICFYSVHKLIKGMYSGGILEIFNKEKNINNINQNLKPYKVDIFQFVNNFLDKNFYNFKRYLKFIFFKIPDYDKINGIRNNKILKDYTIDYFSLKILNKIDQNMIKEKRMNNYKTWKKFCVKEKGFTLINRKIKKNTVPWLFPAFVKDNTLRKKLFKYGWENGYSITSWPSLPRKQINYRTKKIWNKLVCFNTDRAPNIKNINFDY